MKLRIARIENLPLGARILRQGVNGADVKELQELLTQNGFYFGKIDGRYGLLTEEAVRWLQRTFRLKVDGITGREVINTLKNPSRFTGRLIYAVKYGDTIQTICRKFNVNASAWATIPRRKKSGTHLSPGTRLLLHEKALFLWDSSGTRKDSHSKGGLSNPEHLLHSNIRITKTVSPGWRIETNGDLTQVDSNSLIENNTYRTIEALPEVWNALFTSKALRAKLGDGLRKITAFDFGFDLRAAPLDTVINWPVFIHSLGNTAAPPKIRFIILPLLPNPGGRPGKYPDTHTAAIYWSFLPLLAKYTELFIFETCLDTASPSSYENSAAEMLRALRQLSNCGLNHMSLLIVAPQCRDWNLELHHSQAISYSKAKIIRAINPHASKYSTVSMLTTINYTGHQQSHCLVYRDIQGFTELFTLVNKVNLLGVVIRDFEILGKAGIEVILNSFTVLPEQKLNMLLRMPKTKS